MIKQKPNLLQLLHDVSRKIGNPDFTHYFIGVLSVKCPRKAWIEAIEYAKRIWEKEHTK